MTDHTPEPWKPFDDPPLTMITLTKQDYDRARACVNACAGIKTKQLGDVNALVEALGEAEAILIWLASDDYDSGPEIREKISRWREKYQALAPFLRED